MRSTSADRRRGRMLALAGAIALASAGVAHAQDAGATAASAIAPAAPAASGTDAASRAAAVQAAVKTLQADPLLSGKRMTHTLKWNDDADEPEKKKKPDASSFAWLRDFIAFLNDTSRILFYGLIAVLVAVLLVSARHFVQLRSFRRRAAAANVVSHVRDLDVRPESLPDDIGAAAWALWRAGRVPGALSLLYRGALSRLIHRHAVAISAATTEGECLDLARGRIDASAHRYLTQVVRAWEANIYGGRVLSDAMGEALCSGFATRLDGVAAASGEPAP